MKIIEKREGGVELIIEGNITHVLGGEVRADRVKRVDLKEIPFALGGGTFRDLSHIGETIVLGGMGSVYWVERGANHIETHADLISPFLMGVNPKGAGGLLLLEDRRRSVGDFYAEWAELYPDGFVVMGRGVFAELHSSYLIRAPIYGENINRFKEAYWAHLPIAHDATFLSFGVVIPKEGQKKFSSETLGRAFYQNPGDTTASSFLSHTHVALIKPEGKWGGKELGEFLEGFPGPHRNAVHHLFNQSELLEGTFAILPLNRDVKSAHHSD